MDPNIIVEALRATLDPAQREAAEKQLEQVHKIIAFSPLLLQIVTSDQLDMPVRQAGVIYLKNFVTQFWADREKLQLQPSDPLPFAIHEQDRQVLRSNVIEALIHTQDPVRVQLAVITSTIIKHDFPERWPELTQKIATFLRSENTATWMGSLIALYQLIKHFEYKSSTDRAPLTQAMAHLLPVIHERCRQLLPDSTELAVALQQQILKCFYCLVQFSLPLDLVSKEAFSQWMDITRQILERPVPPQLDQVEEDTRSELVWWKVKKWACHVLTRTFERYGSPGSVMKEYTKFAEWYLKNFTTPTINIVLKILSSYRQKEYLSPRVLQLVLSYLHQAVSHAATWNLIKHHMQDIVQEIIFPLMCHNDEDQHLWENDPIEYIRSKYDVYEELLSPASAAQTLLHGACEKRKQVLEKTLQFSVAKLHPDANVDPRQKDGALRIIGAVSELLLKKKVYKDQAEAMLVQLVYPEFQSPVGFLRARACWAVHYFAEVKFKDMNNLGAAVELTRQCLCNDKDLPVKFEAAIALQALISEHEKAKQYIQAHVQQVVLELLGLIRETENDDITTVMQKLVCSYVEEITPIAVEMTQHLAQTFIQVVDGDKDGQDDKALAAMGLLNTIETVLTVMEHSPEILSQLESIVMSIIGFTLQHSVMEFYEEVLSLIYILTSQHISDQMWQMFETVYGMFQNDGFDYFTEMMPCLHNYVTVVPQKFSSDPKHLEIVYNMCKAVLTNSDSGEDAECHAAKLLEVLLLQYRGLIDSAVPLIVELVVQRLTREVRTSELRTLCLQVVIAAVYYNAPALLAILDKMQIAGGGSGVLLQFLTQWLHDCDCFLGLHDRRMCVLGLCCLLTLPTNSRPAAVNEIASKILPSALVVFKGLKKAYESRAQDEKSSDSEENGDASDSEYVAPVLEDDEDDINEDDNAYLEKLENNDDSNDEDYDDDDDSEETALESYETPLDKDDCDVDEYCIFRSILTALPHQDPAWYEALTKSLTEEQLKEVQDIFVLADQRKAVQDSKKIELGGGYQFVNVQVPTTFNFGGAPPSV